MGLRALAIMQVATCPCLRAGISWRMSVMISGVNSGYSAASSSLNGVRGPREMSSKPALPSLVRRTRSDMAPDTQPAQAASEPRTLGGRSSFTVRSACAPQPS